MQKVSPRCCQAFGVHFFVWALPLPLLLPSLSLHSASFMWLKCLVQLRPDQTRPDQTRRAAFFALLLPQSLNYLVFQLFVVGFRVLPLPLPNSLLSFLFVWQGTVL